MTSRTAVVEQFVAAINAGDMAGAMALLSPDLAIYHSSRMPYRGVFHGHEGFGRMLQIIGEFWETFGSAEPPQFVEVADAAVVVGKLRGKPRHYQTELIIPVMERYTIDGGLITRIDPCYVDLDLTPEQLGTA